MAEENASAPGKKVCKLEFAQCHAPKHALKIFANESLSLPNLFPCEN
jgi:hypothetical protein